MRTPVGTPSNYKWSAALIFWHSHNTPASQFGQLSGIHGYQEKVTNCPKHVPNSCRFAPPVVGLPPTRIPKGECYE